ncbi:MAG: hypothetical protein PUP91_37430 [Rhizonema sp. PD37]|nr:hypothetical protein [Rhizonema sp. PD37]
MPGRWGGKLSVWLMEKEYANHLYHSSQDMSANNCEPSAICDLLFTISYLLSAISHLTSAICYQLSAYITCLKGFCLDVYNLLLSLL